MSVARYVLALFAALSYGMAFFRFQTADYVKAQVDLTEACFFVLCLIASRVLA